MITLFLYIHSNNEKLTGRGGLVTGKGGYPGSERRGLYKGLSEVLSRGISLRRMSKRTTVHDIPEHSKDGTWPVDFMSFAFERNRVYTRSRLFSRGVRTELRQCVFHRLGGVPGPGCTVRRCGAVRQDPSAFH